MLHVLLRAGVLALALLVTAPGAALAQRFVPVADGIHVVDVGGGSLTAVAVDPVSGFPRVAHTSPLNVSGDGDSLRYAAWNGSSWSGRCVDSSVGDFPSITIGADGRAHIAYNNANWRPDLVNGQLKYVVVSATGVAGTPETLEMPTGLAPQGRVHRDTSIKLDPATGRPRISFYHTRDVDENDITDNLWYASFDGTDWTFSLVKKWFTDPAWEIEQVGKWNALTLDPITGTPTIAYYDNVGNRDGETTPVTVPTIDRGLALATPDASPGGWAKQLLDSTTGSNDAGFFVSMVLDGSGGRHVSYISASEGTVKYVGPGVGPEVVAGVAWADNATVNSIAAETAVVVLPNGEPIIAYTDFASVDGAGEPVLSSGRVMIAERVAVNSWQTQAIENGGVGLGLSMAATPNGHLVLAYRDQVNGQLKVAFVQDTNPGAGSLDFGTPSAWNDASATTTLCSTPGGGGGGGGGGGVITGDNDVARGFFSCGVVSSGKGGPGDPPLSSVVADLAPLALLLAWMAWRTWRARRRRGGVGFEAVAA